MSPNRTLALVALTAVTVAAAMFAARGAIESAVGDAMPEGTTDAVAALEPEEDELADTDERVMDLEHLTPEDLGFLEEVLTEGIPEGRRSATRALVIAGHPAGMGMLLSLAIEGEDDADLFCLGALEIARLQRKEEVLRALLLALEQDPPLTEGCRYEVSDRFAIVGGRDPMVQVALIDDPEPNVRAWALQALSEEEGEVATAALISRLADPELEIRRQAWLVWEGRSVEPHREALEAAQSEEGDPELRARAREILGGG